MCGRYTLISIALLHGRFRIVEAPALPPLFNIAPSQAVPIIRRRDRAGAELHLDMARWGLIPSWAKDSAIGNRLINARAETIADKPAFRSAYKYRRCVLPADGFYEWKPLAPARKSRPAKQPYYFHTADRQPFGLAGLWEHWQDPASGGVDTCTVLTTTPNSLLKDFHDRMPVMLTPEQAEAWLNPDAGANELRSLLAPFPAEMMRSYPVGKLVNDPKNRMPQCIDPVKPDVATEEKAATLAKLRGKKQADAGQGLLFSESSGAE